MHVVERPAQVARRERTVAPTERIAVVVRVRKQQRADEELLEHGDRPRIPTQCTCPLDVYHRQAYLLGQAAAIACRKIDNWRKGERRGRRFPQQNGKLPAEGDRAQRNVEAGAHALGLYDERGPWRGTDGAGWATGNPL